MANARVVSDPQMKILSLDQATRTSGWALFEDSQLIDFGKFTFDDANILKRIHKVCAQLQILILTHKPDKIVFEDIAMQGQINNVQTFKALAQLQGAIAEICFQTKIPFDIWSPNQWRAECRFLRGNDKDRNAQKKIAQQWVIKQFGQKCTQDEADAICIGYAADHSANNELNWE